MCCTISVRNVFPEHLFFKYSNYWMNKVKSSEGEIENDDDDCGNQECAQCSCLGNENAELRNENAELRKENREMEEKCTELKRQVEFLSGVISESEKKLEAATDQPCRSPMVKSVARTVRSKNYYLETRNTCSNPSLALLTYQDYIQLSANRIKLDLLTI